MGTAMIELKVKKLDGKAILPKYATDGAGCFDIHSTTAGFVSENQTMVFSTGLSFEIPDGFVMLVFSRSGHGFKNNVRLSNCVGVIDSDYRGELKVKLTSDTDGSIVVERGDRIAQAMIIPFPKVNLVVVDELSKTDRGAGGMGSTGVR
jgi:dUTP pyrophosphatase